MALDLMAGLKQLRDDLKTWVSNNIRYINTRLGTSDISNVSDGTVTGAINTLDTLVNKNTNDINSNTNAITALNDALNEIGTVLKNEGYSDAQIEPFAIGDVTYLTLTKGVWVVTASVLSQTDGICFNIGFSMHLNIAPLSSSNLNDITGARIKGATVTDIMNIENETQIHLYCTPMDFITLYHVSFKAVKIA